MRGHYLVICPEYPPETTGLAGHTRAFAEELARESDVTVLTSEGAAAPAGSAAPQVAARIRSWKFPGIFRLLREIRAAAPDRIVLQYLPFLYGRRGGINFSLCLVAWIARLRGGRIDLICHELYYPLQPRPKAVLMFTAHVAMLFLLGLASDRVFATTALFATRARRILLCRRTVHVLPVGSNMPWVAVARDELERFRRAQGLAGKRVVACFGTSHPTRDFGLVAGALADWAEAKREKLAILCVGETREQLLAGLGAAERGRLEPYLAVLGKVDEHRFALAMASAEASVAYFRDGASTRRGSLMATLAYGVPTISSRTSTTDAVLLGLRDLSLLPAAPEAFRAAFPAALDAALASGGAERVPSTCYRERFGWDRIASRFRDPGAISPGEPCSAPERLVDS